MWAIADGCRSFRLKPFHLQGFSASPNRRQVSASPFVLGQKRSFRVLLPNVRFAPIADIWLIRYLGQRIRARERIVASLGYRNP